MRQSISRVFKRKENNSLIRNDNIVDNHNGAEFGKESKKEWIG